MSNTPSAFTHCLRHQLPEDQASTIGLVCPRCKQRLYLSPPSGHCMTFWESQPAAYSLNREPCFAFTLIWDDFRIRSLHPAASDSDSRFERVKRETVQRADGAHDWSDLLARGLPIDTDSFDVDTFEVDAGEFDFEGWQPDDDPSESPDFE